MLSVKKKITRKTDVKDYCIWYLDKVQKRAKASEMVSYALEHNLVAKNIPLNSRVISYYLRDQKVFDREKTCYGIFIYQLALEVI